MNVNNDIGGTVNVVGRMCFENDVDGDKGASGDDN